MRISKFASSTPSHFPRLETFRAGSFGRDFGEIMHILWHKEYADQVVRIFRHTLVTGYPHVRPEGAQQRRDRGYYEGRVDRILLSDGRFGIVCYFRGISAQVQAREMQNLLLSELNHRVKNTLASVQAIMQHTLRAARNTDDFANSFTGRIQSMSRAHSLLSSSSWKGADLRELIRDQLFSGTVDEKRLTAWGPAVHLEPQTARHLALMLHELGTNSAKYGALSKPEGYVAVSWTVESGLLRLHWFERGGPPVSVPMRRGFGTILIEESARGGGGDARVLVEAQGLSWEITLLLATIESAPNTAAAEIPTVRKQARSERRSLVGEQLAILAGRRVLVVEDEPLVALEIVASLKKAGAQPMGPVGTPEQALVTIERDVVDAALLDANLRGRRVDAIAAALTRRGVPFLLVTGYGRASLPEAFGKVPLLSKPFTEAQLLEAAVAMLDRPGSHSDSSSECDRKRRPLVALSS